MKRHFLEFYNKLEELLLAVSMLIMVILNFANVMSRYLLKASISFTEELIIILFIWSTMVAAALAFKRKAHIALSVFTDLLPGKIRRIIFLFGSAATVFLMIVLIYNSFLMLKNQMRFELMTSVLEIPEVYVSSAIVIGAVLILLRVVEVTIHDLKNDFTAEEDDE